MGFRSSSYLGLLLLATPTIFPVCMVLAINVSSTKTSFAILELSSVSVTSTPTYHATLPTSTQANNHNNSSLTVNPNSPKLTLKARQPSSTMSETHLPSTLCSDPSKPCSAQQSLPVACGRNSPCTTISPSKPGIFLPLESPALDDESIYTTTVHSLAFTTDSNSHTTPFSTATITTTITLSSRTSALPSTTTPHPSPSATDSNAGIATVYLTSTVSLVPYATAPLSTTNVASSTTAPSSAPAIVPTTSRSATTRKPAVSRVLLWLTVLASMSQLQLARE